MPIKDYNTIFVSLDGTEAQTPIFEKAVRAAIHSHAALILGHVVDMSKYDLASVYDATLISQVVDYAREEMEELAIAAREAGVEDVTVEVRYGSVRQTLVDELVKPLAPDLVVCGDRGLNRVQYILVGSVSSYLIHNVECDVLVVKDEVEVTEGA